VDFEEEGRTKDREEEVQGQIANKGKPPLDASLILYISYACIISDFIKCMSFYFHFGG
jgi:hypothetical protein